MDFHRNLVPDRNIVLAQLGTLAWRGGDGEEIFTSPHAVIGHRRRAAVDLDGGRQPMSEETTVLAFDGQIYNHRELRHELGLRGHRFRTRSDTEVILRAYLEWGEESAARLNGMFAFALWDSGAERLLLARDRFGVKPLYYHPTDTGVVFGSEPKAVLAHPLVDPVADAGGLRELLAFTSTPGRTPISGMRRVRPGEIVVIDEKGTDERLYWRLVAAPHTDDGETTVRRVRELLEASVARRLAADVPVGVLLSGGVDSSTVAALAALVLRRNGGDRLRTFTVSYKGGQASGPGPMRSSEDAPYARAVAEHIGSEHELIELDSGDMVDPVLRRTAVRAQQDMPVAAPQFPASLRALCRRIGERIGVVLAGEQADTVFASFMGMDDPAVIAAPTYPWIAATAHHLPPQGLGTGLFSPDLLTRLDIPGYCADAYRADLARVPHLEGEDPRDRRMREIYFLHLQGWQEFGCALDDGASLAGGVEVRWPYCDHELVQYLFNVPMEMKTSGGPKGLLRAAAADLLPASVLHRAPSQFPTGRDPAYAPMLKAELRRVLADPASPVLPLLDLAAVNALLAGPGEPRRAWRDLTDMEMVLQINQWLDQYRIRIAL
ncbi:asparagine synthase (glutamine-hydrolyzing) [Microbispora hainanensis]|uniref:asparagine synthase (glutamine-hydrolyzing) n=1 Tax=Microbispora hainanensis TaxID=568844 RepID=A0A544Z2T7_9ACTN|nr:asparagine synthase (glutamine-hydrolyzing) [Microbispora hainanensis]